MQDFVTGKLIFFLLIIQFYVSSIQFLFKKIQRKVSFSQYVRKVFRKTNIWKILRKYYINHPKKMCFTLYCYLKRQLKKEKLIYQELFEVVTTSQHLHQQKESNCQEIFIIYNWSFLKSMLLILPQKKHSRIKT